MATAKSLEKSKTKKNPQIKLTKKTRTTKTKKIIGDVVTEQKLAPISPEFEEKLTKSYYSIEKYLKVILYGGPAASLYLLYLVIKSKGELFMLLNFLGVVVVSIGLGCSSILFTKQSKKSIVAYGCTMVVVILFLVFAPRLSGSNGLISLLVLVFVFVPFIFMEMLRLKKYNFLY